MASLSNTDATHPPRSNPPLRSSSAPPSPCITPSTETCVTVVSFMVAVPFSLNLSSFDFYRTAAPISSVAAESVRPIIPHPPERRTRIGRAISLGQELRRERQTPTARQPTTRSDALPRLRKRDSARASVRSRGGALPFQLREGGRSEGASAARTGRWVPAGRDVGHRRRRAAPQRACLRRPHPHLSGRTRAGVHRARRACLSGP